MQTCKVLGSPFRDSHHNGAEVGMGVGVVIVIDKKRGKLSWHYVAKKRNETIF